MLLLELTVHVVHVARCLERRVAEAEEGAIRLRVTTFLDEPSGRLGAKGNADDEDQSRDARGTELETPCKLAHPGRVRVSDQTISRAEDGIVSLEDREIRAESQENCYNISPDLALFGARCDYSLPKASHICHDMTRPPRIEAGTFSLTDLADIQVKTVRAHAFQMGTVDALRPMPIPRMRRTMKSCTQLLVNAEPIGVIRQMTPATKVTPRRPIIELRGSLSQQPMKAIAMYGAALTRPTSH